MASATQGAWNTYEDSGRSKSNLDLLGRVYFFFTLKWSNTFR